MSPTGKPHGTRPADGAQVEKRSCVASTIVGDDVVIFTASVLASRWSKISPVVAEMMVGNVYW